MLRFLYPELLLLFLPAAWLFRKFGWVAGATGVLRGLILALVIIALSGPEIVVGGKGLDVIVILDRSKSMPSHNFAELMKSLEASRGEGDRIGLITFGTSASIERLPSANAEFSEFTRDVLADGSDLSDAILRALTTADPNRPTRLLVLSDGEANGPSPLTAANRSAEAKIPVDYRAFDRARIGDSAILAVDLPEQVARGERFQYSVLVFADEQQKGTLQVTRAGRVIATKTLPLEPGKNRVIFRDVIEKGGFHTYDVHLKITDDPLTANNRGLGVIRVEAGPKVLVLSADGAKDSNLIRSLLAGKIPFETRSADNHALTQDSLDEFRAVILENVPAHVLGRRKMARLAQWVEDLGGGLMMTGGETSFGSGGFYKSPLDPLLPVSLELRDEQRKNAIAIAVVLDNSGSMRAPVGNGSTKMELAVRGSEEVVKLMSPADSLCVMTVDTSPDVVQPMEKVTQRGTVMARLKKITVGGGGIFIDTALRAAREQLDKAAAYSTRHLILFSDANDSERPGRFKEILAGFRKDGITVSVIGLGTEQDRHAQLLQQIAQLGGGNIRFTRDARELPRLFAEDAMNVARSSFIRADKETQPDGIGVDARGGLSSIADFGKVEELKIPNVGGYSLSYLRPQAFLGARSDDEYEAPIAAYWTRGLGRVAALTLEVDGKYTGRFANWDQYAAFLVTHTRWLLGGENPNEVFVDLKREGQEAVISVELDPDRPNQLEGKPPRLIVVPPGAERESVILPDLVWTGPDSLRGRFRMDRVGTYRTMVQTGEREFTRGPALALPYSPEWVPRVGLPNGRAVLSRMAAASGGQSRTDLTTIWTDPPRAPVTESLLLGIVIAIVALLVIEIAGRRLGLWKLISEKLGHKTTEPAIEESDESQPPPGWRPRWHLRRRKHEAEPLSLPEEEEVEPDLTRTADEVFREAKSRARDRMK